jgi:hypothetical protein
MTRLGLVGPLLVFLSILSLGCDGKSQREEAQKRETARREVMLREFAARYQADTVWPNRFKGRFRIHTIELQDALHVGTGKPVLLRGNVRDIYRDGKKIVVVLEVGWEPSLELSFTFLELFALLECPELPSTALRPGKMDLAGLGREAALVAVISNIRKPILEVEPQSNEGLFVDASNTRIAEGRCLDWMSLSEGGDN